MFASTTMWVIVNIKTNTGLFMLQKTVKKNAKAINTVKDTEKNVRMEYIATLNKNGSLYMKTKVMKIS